MSTLHRIPHSETIFSFFTNRSTAVVRFRALWSGVVLAMLVGLAGCASSGGQSEEGGDQKSFRFELSCSGGQAIVRRLDTESGLPTEEGPVQLPSGTECGTAEDMDEAAIRKFPRNGDWTFYHKGTKTPLRTGRYVNGKREGEWLGYDNQGRMDRKISYQNGEKNGPETGFIAGTNQWDERGQNVDGKRDGVWETRHGSGDGCISKGAYVADQKNGAWEECSQDAKTRKWYRSFEGGYLGGFRHGPAVAYDADGKKIAEGEYFADTSDECRKNPPGGRGENCGKRDGEWKIYFPDGKLAMQGNYDRTSGNRSGNWVEYYQSGEKMAEGPREHTRRGRWKFYDKRGGVFFEGDFNGNDFSPVYAVVYENGRKTSEGQLSIGLIKYEVETDSIKVSKLIQNGQWVLYDANGRKVGEGEMVAGKKNGKWLESAGGRVETNCYMLGKARACD